MDYKTVKRQKKAMRQADCLSAPDLRKKADV
jgi:hypothetical protein